MSDMTKEKYWDNLINQSLLRFCLLKTLEKEELHAYVLPKKIDEFSHGYCATPSPGTLYTTVSGLEQEGYLQTRSAKKGGRTRKLYKLSSKGRQALQSATKSWSKVTFLIAKSCIYKQWE
ncbi:MAG: PadR family transcriptional regulator [bacterium]|nr:PadR family transcriptional regulator [bacterium]